jgi:hypothetical protein
MSLFLRSLAFVLALMFTAPAVALEKAEMVKVLETLDARQRNSGDYKALTYIEQKQKGKSDRLYEITVYRRDADDKFMILFLKPKSESGKGYLRLDRNLFLYDPAVGKWERRTERERIGGTNSRRRDFDESRLAEEYDPSFVGEEKLGKFDTYHLRLTEKKGVDVPYPVVEIWVHKDTNNLLKQQDFALSGRLLRTSYYPQWARKFSESKGADIYYPKQIRIFDEVEKGTSTTIVLREMDLRSLPTNIFTKAWLESKSR